jgi:CHAD domain-containing protein
MPVDQKRTQSLFRNLSRVAGKLAADAQPEKVHQFRTTTRRIEALFGELAPKADRNGRKLLKQLAKIRKRAGRVRDLDVQMAALRTLTIGRDGLQKRELMSTLAAERSRCEKKLLAALDPKTLRTLRKRLRRAAKDPLQDDGKLEPVGKALRLFAQLARQQGEVSEAVLHQYRLRCKRIRYVAEMAGKEPQAEAVVEQLKAIQDGIGEWHDWDTLTARAETLFAEAPNAPIIIALRAVRHSKLAEALRATHAARAVLLEMHEHTSYRAKPARSAVPRRREAEPVFATAAVA